MKENQTQNNKESDSPNDQIVHIPVDQIHRNTEQDTGIRDQEKFELLKKSIASIGLINSIIVRPENGGYETIAGHNRLEAAKQNGWNKIPAKIKNVDADEAAEMCLADNLVHSNYTPRQMEEKIYLRWKNGNYQSQTDLARKIGLSDVWVSKLIEAHELRSELQEKNPKLVLDSFSSQTLLDAKKILDKKILAEDGDLIRFLEIAITKKYKPNKIIDVITALNQWDVKWRNMVLYEDVSYDKARMMMQNETNKPVPKQKKTTKISVVTIKKNFVEDTYKELDKSLSDAIGSIEDENDKAKSLRYVRVTMALYGEVLNNYGEITKEQLKQIKEDILGIKIPARNYDGDPDLQKLAAFYDVQEDSKVSSDSDPPKPKEG